CLADHVCVEETCRHEESACGDADGDGGCPGNKTCETGSGEAECVEPDTCETSFDCDGDRQCNGRTCQDPVSCSDDAFEPNDEADEATDFFAEAKDHTVEASLCSEDVDVYTFDSEDIAGGDERGELLVEVDIADRVRGLGSIEGTLTDSDGNEMTADTGAQGAEGSLVFEEEIGIGEHDDYTLELSAGEDMTEAGVAYDLSVNLLSGTAADACEDAPRLRVDERVDGNTDEAASNDFNSSCTESPNDSGEEIYRVEVDSPRELTFDLMPHNSSDDLTMSVRSRCTQESSERGCVDYGGAGDSESLTVLLEEGTHYVVVQSKPDASGGPYTLEASSVETTCAEAGSYCEDEVVSRTCRPDGGAYEALTCDEGCNPSTGRCFAPEGDTCEAPTEIEYREDGSAEEPNFSEEIDFTQARNDYELPGDSCVASEASRTGGPDRVFQIDLPAMTALNAEVEFDDEVEGSMYLVEDCDEPNDSCLVGAQDTGDNASQESLIHPNQSEDEESLYLVVDTEDDQWVESADLDVYFEEVVCEPDEKRCNPDDELVAEVCNENGTGWNEEEVCAEDFPCESGECPRPDDCDGAPDITDDARQDGGVSFNGLIWDNFTNAFYDPDGYNCHNDWAGAFSEDVVFELDLDAGETVNVSTEVTGVAAAAIAISTDCSDALNTCVAGAYDWGDPNAELEYEADDTRTYYLIVDHDTHNDSDDSVDVTVEIE
ncbi:MAG: hypothetical protein ACOCV2_11505, partial [Persicimonas sp.]